MRVQHDPGTLNDQMNVATTPHKLLQLAEQVTLDTERTRARTARQTLSIDLAFGLFPKPGSSVGPSVLGVPQQSDSQPEEQQLNHVAPSVRGNKRERDSARNASAIPRTTRCRESENFRHLSDG